MRRMADRIPTTHSDTGNRNYAAACYPLNAARRLLKPRDGSFDAMEFAITVVMRVDVHYAQSLSPYANRTVPRLQR